MPVSAEELRSHLQAFDFPRLFVEGLGWDHFQVEPLVLPVDGHEYALKPVAEKAQFAVFECAPGPDGAIPEYPVRRKIETQVTKRAFEHLIIFVDATRTQQVWQWVKRQAGKPTACREHQFHTGQTGQPLLQRLDGFIVTLEDEARGIGITDVVSLIGKAFDVEKVTKRFYERFQAELIAFGDFIEGITAHGDRGWYASLMLNRMMFVYFVQKQGFLDGNTDYLRTKLRQVQTGYGDGRFQQFYREFLLKLFHHGLGLPRAQRAPELAALLGEVPFLNGGLFDQHELERDNPDISIPDAAFERVFDFFDGYRWHLDERPYREDNEINPDVLGYIFEKYVNQKQMGAYYTKEDITGYISRNTVIPFLFDAARKECPVAFGPDGGVWRLLRDDPDRYIYPAVGHGITWNARQAEARAPLNAPFDLPDDIAAGISDVSKRAGWNAPATEDYALPTETWREVVARRSRYYEVRAKLADGEVTEVNDLITLNLDIERFARDVIAQSEGPELLRAFWHALYGNRERSDTGISVLDPTCGSGAFLFAALNVLEPLYTACLEGKRGFLDDAERSERKRSPEHLGDFRRILEQVDKHPSERYFILKSIVLNNLYGVDIMEEAVEICKLRLFLRLVAQLESYDQIEPLPDIDFNVRAGNTLVGFTSLDAVRQAMTVMPNGQHRQVFPEDQAALDRINEEAEVASAAFNQFRWQQTMLGGEVTSADKRALRERLRSLADELDRYLASEYGIVAADPNEHNVEPDKKPDCDKLPGKHNVYQCWRTSHQPFHWFAEFYGIMSDGGFDVVIGNPPWREYSAVKKEYQVRVYDTASCGNLYALCAERSIELASQKGWFSFIIQLPSLSSSRMVGFRELLIENSSRLYYIPFDDRPGKLFDGLQHCRSVILLANVHTGSTSCSIQGTRYQRWSSEAREHLFPGVSFITIPDIRSHRRILPKLATQSQVSLFRQLGKRGNETISIHLRRLPTSHFVFYQEAMQYWAKATYGLPFYSKNDIEGAPPHGRYLYTDQSPYAQCIGAVLNSSLFYLYFVAYGDCFHLSDTIVREFPMAKSIMGDSNLSELGRVLMKDLHEKSIEKTIDTKLGDSITYEEFFAGGSKPIVDEIDRVLAEHYGFTDEELDFIINYDIKYRMGREG